jgi:hypothetical protein
MNNEWPKFFRPVRPDMKSQLALVMLSGAAVMQNLTIIFSGYTGGQDGLNGSRSRDRAGAASENRPQG